MVESQMGFSRSSNHQQEQLRVGVSDRSQPGRTPSPQSLSSCLQAGPERLPDASQPLANAIRALLGDALADVEQLIQETIRSRFPPVNCLSARAAAMGGKRLRPMLVLLSARASQLQPLTSVQSEDLCAIAAAVELVHAASLVHDDVLDDARERRHQSTIVHQAGNASAVLLGDFLFTRAYAVAARCRTTYAARQIAAAATQLCEGELRQQASAANWAISPREYRDILLQKTAALCEVSCRLGAWRAGAGRELRKALAQYGNALGLAFQIYDDWLDYWGDGQVGKTLGTDLLQLKPTLPLIRLLQTSTAHERSRLTGLLDAGGGDALAEIRDELQRSDAGSYTLQIAHRYAERAKLKLSCLPASVTKDCLLAVADYSVQRSV